MKAYLIVEETPEKAVTKMNEMLKHFDNKPVSVAWRGDLTACVITSNFEPESLEETEEIEEPLNEEKPKSGKKSTK